MTQDNPNNPKSTGSDSDQPASEQQKIATALQSIERYLQSPRNEPTQYQREQHTWAIRTGKGVIVYTALTAIIMIASICASIYSRQQVEISRQSQRPWIAGPTLIVKVTGDQIAFHGAYENVGQMPTYGLDIKANIVDATKADLMKSIKNFCEGRRTWANDNIDYFRMFSAIPHSPFPSGIAPEPTTLEAIKGVHDPWIIGCVVYGWRGDDELHKTGFVARIIIQDGRLSVPEVASVLAD